MFFLFKPWLNNQTLLVKYFRFALQWMCDCFATSQNTAWQRLWLSPIDQTLLVKHLRFALQWMCDCFATSQTLLDKTISSQSFWESLKHFLLVKSKRCLTTNVLRHDQAVKHCVWRLTSKFQTFDEQCLMVWTETRSNKSFKSVILRPWLNNQTLSLKHRKFSSFAKCITVWPHHKRAFFVFDNQTMLLTFAESIAKQFCLSSNVLTWPNGQKLFVRQLSSVWPKCLIVWLGIFSLPR